MECGSSTTWFDVASRCRDEDGITTLLPGHLKRSVDPGNGSL